MSSGSAVGAVLAGYFAAVGAFPGVLLGPVSLLVAGIGTGARAIDGRLRQPGREAKRPKGRRPEEEASVASRVAVPTSVPALLVGHTYAWDHRLAGVLRVGRAEAKREAAEGRLELLEAIASHGAATFNTAMFVRPLLHAASPQQGGLLSRADFITRAEDIDCPAVTESTSLGSVLRAPWANQPGEAAGVGHALCAVDGAGQLAALCFRRVAEGIEIPELDLLAPEAAVPVVHGEPRLKPGSALGAPAPIALVVDETGAPLGAYAEPNAAQLDVAQFGNAQLRLVVQR